MVTVAAVYGATHEQKQLAGTANHPKSSVQMHRSKEITAYEKLNRNKQNWVAKGSPSSITLHNCLSVSKLTDVRERLDRAGSYG